MNRFLAQTINLISQNGLQVTYKSIQGDSSTYNVETGSVTRTSTSYSVKAYPKHIKASQYNYPDLVGKQVCMFYVANNALPFSFKFQDEFVYNSITYKVQSWEEHFAEGELCLYKVLCVKG